MAFRLERHGKPFSLARKQRPEEADDRSLVGKGVDLYKSSKNALRGGIKKVVETMQETPVSDLIPKPSILSPLNVDQQVKNIGIPFIEGARENFSPDADIKASDILEGIPDIETGLEVNFDGGGIKRIDKPFRLERDSVSDENDEGQDSVDRAIDFITATTPDFLAGGILQAAKKIKNTEHETKRNIASLMTTGKPSSVKLDTVLNLPKRAAEFSLDTVTDPLLLALEAAGPAIKKTYDIPIVARGLKKVADGIKNVAINDRKVFGVFRRGGGADNEFIQLWDDTSNEISAIQERAVEHSKYIQSNFKPFEDKRIAQIARGGITSNPEYRAAAEVTQDIMGSLEKEAKRLGFLRDTYRTKLTRNQLATYRKNLVDIQARIEKLKTKGAAPFKDKLLEMAAKVKIKGDVALGKSIESLAGKVESGADKFGPLYFKTAAAVDNLKNVSDLTKGRIIAKIGSLSEQGVFQADDVMRDILALTDDVEKIGIQGIKPLVRAIGKISGRFPGQTGIIRKLEEKAGDISKRIVQHYTEGGRGYLPRLYEIFESGMAGKMAKQGVSIDDLIALPEDQLAAIQSLAPGEFKAFIKKLSKRIPKTDFRTMRIGGERFKHRGDIPSIVRKAMGEIQTASYPFAKGAAQLARDVKTAQFFDTVSKNPKWALSPDDFKLASGLKGKWTRLPDNKNLGALAGMMVPSEIGNEVLYITRTPGFLRKHWETLLSKWKFGKVILNPSTHFRNMFSNSILLDLSGVDFLAQTRLIPKAAREMMSKGEYYQEAKSTGLLRSGFFDNEIKAFLPSFEKTGGDITSRILAGSKSIANKLGDVYQSEESLAKMAKFIAGREKGLGIKEAALEAEKWLFNYGKLSPATRYLRQSPLGAPFITFTAKALPRIAETAVTNPARLYKYKAIFNSIEDMAKEKLNIDDDEMSWIKKTFRGTSLVLPLKDKYGLPMVLDLSYILPWGDIGEEGGFFGLPNVLPPGGPVMAGIQAGLNKNAYLDQPIRKPLESWWIKTADTIDFLYKSFLPSWAPGINVRESPARGGFSFDKMISTLRKKPDYRGRVRDLSWTLADTVFGIKAFPVNPNEKQFFESLRTNRSINDRIRNAKRVLRHPGVSEEAKAREKMRLAKDIQRAILKYKEKGRGR